jgi:hypothetical protein
MSLYWVKKPFSRLEKGGGSKVVLRPGGKVVIELRSEAEKLLADGCITKDRPAPGTTGKPDTESDNLTHRVPTFTPEQTQEMQALAVKAGMPFSGVEAQVLNRMADKETPADVAIRAFRKAQGLLTAKELIEDAAAALHEKEEVLQAEIHELAKEFKLGIGEVIERLTLARKIKRKVKDVLAEIQAAVETRTKTPRQAMADIEKAATPEAPKAQPRLDAQDSANQRVSEVKERRKKAKQPAAPGGEAAKA